MKLLYWGTDGGKDSTVKGFWLIEIKSLFSIVLLRFSNGTRDAYHEHAFDSVSWLIRGRLRELHLGGPAQEHRPSWRPIRTFRKTFHMVRSIGTRWVLSLRGPWKPTWREYQPERGLVLLTHGRVEVACLPEAQPTSGYIRKVAK